VKWTVIVPLVLLVVVGGFVAIRPADRALTEISGDAVGSEADTGYGGAAMPPALRSNPRAVHVKDDLVSVLVHCNRIAPCDGYAALESPKTGALLGVRDYHLKAGADTRIRVPLQPGTRERRVRLSWQQDASGWSGGWYDLTLRR
jgi:hypothetical protein